MELTDDDCLQIYWEDWEKYRTLSWLKTSFESTYEKSQDKEELLKREIEGYNLVFDENKFPLEVEINDWDWEPLLRYSIVLHEWEIILIRMAYLHFIVEGNDISEGKNWIKNKNYLLPQKFTDATYFIDLANTLKEYIAWLKNFSNKINKPIIPEEYILLIYKEYQSYFENELKESWVARFNYSPDSPPIKLIPLSREAREGTNKLILIAILAAIQQLTGNEFDYNNFVLKRFGIKAFEKMKSDHKEKKTYKETFKKCNTILKK